MSEGNSLASKYVIGVGMVIIAAIAFIAGFFAAPLINPSQQTTEDVIWKNIVAAGKIRIGTDPSWPPYESLNSSGQIVGFEVDLADAIAAKLGLTTEWRSVGFDTIIASA